MEVVKEIHGSAADGGTEHNGLVTETSRMPFLMLGLDLPPPPLFKDVMEKNIIPQVCFPILISFLLIFLTTGLSVVPALRCLTSVIDSQLSICTHIFQEKQNIHFP